MNGGWNARTRGRPDAHGLAAGSCVLACASLLTWHCVRFVFACMQAFHTGELGLTKDGDQPPEAAEITNQLEAVSV